MGNIDALKLLFRMVSECSNPDVRIHAVHCIQDILSANPLNVVDVMTCEGIEQLVRVLQAEGAEVRDRKEIRDAIL